MTNECVVAIDVSPTHAYLSVVFRDGRDPMYSVVRFPSVDEALDTNTTRMVEIARRNSELVSAKLGKLPAPPTLVVMSKLFLFDMKHDPSGARRAGLWWEVAQRVLDLRGSTDDYRLCEVAPMSAQRVVTGRSVPGKQGFADTERGLRALYPTLAERLPSDYRWYVLGEALTAAVALGWSTPLTVTNSSLSAMRGRVNSFPVDVPKTVDDWKQKNAEHKAVYRSTTPKEKIA